MTDSVIRVKRYHYVHILDNNTYVTRTVVGPVIYTRKEHERCLFEPRPCIAVPPEHWCIVKNPCVRTPTGEVDLDLSGQARIHLGDTEIRLAGDPFPLYPGEELAGEAGAEVQLLRRVSATAGLRLRCVRDFHDDGSNKIVRAGAEWVVAGPMTYQPRVEVEVVEELRAIVVHTGTAPLLEALADFTDRHGTSRVAGERWLHRTTGAFLPAVEEMVISVGTSFALDATHALHLRAMRGCTDVYGRTHNAGDEWLVTAADAPSHIMDAYETLVKKVKAVALGRREYAVVHHPVDESGRNRFGETAVRQGPRTFFLQPRETLPAGVQTALVVGKEEALLLEALYRHEDGGEVREPGRRWMLRGPCEYIPSNQARLLEHRRVITLDKNEGVYVMNTTTGDVRAVVGEPYLPDVNEVLWEKPLPLAVEELLESPNGGIETVRRDPNFTSHREKHRVVRFNVQHNAAVQIYDYRKKEPRIVLGPNLVMLAPYEEFTVLSLSGGTPKVPNSLQSLQLFLGPRFSSDTVVVETSDHARLRLRLSYNWYFDMNRSAPDQKTFSVPDFIGDCCKTIASRVRGAVAGEDFDSFHRNSARIIRTAVFGLGEAGEVKKELRFTANNFVITNIDVQSSEPTDEKTRDSLQKSVQLAIEITTKSQEAAARHGNELKDQEAKGQLERQKLADKIAVEQAKTRWLELQAQSEALQASGQSVAEAKARAETLLIEVRSELQLAELRAKAYRISAEAELQKLQQRQALELDYTNRQNELDVVRARAAAEAEATKVRRIVDAVGRDTLISIARAGPETQAKLLSSLGLKGYLMTDGNSPVNLFSAAQGMLGESKK